MIPLRLNDLISTLIDVSTVYFKTNTIKDDKTYLTYIN